MKYLIILTLLFEINITSSQSGWFLQSSGTNNILYAVHFLNLNTGFTVRIPGRIYGITKSRTIPSTHDNPA
jgi:hypothetical protein